ncbi:MAG: hypothetical protein JKY50_00200 [Oleispira sp.]|nr:hypothetical protein [Oleispira sp.]
MYDKVKQRLELNLLHAQVGLAYYAALENNDVLLSKGLKFHALADSTDEEKEDFREWNAEEYSSIWAEALELKEEYYKAKEELDDGT